MAFSSCCLSPPVCVALKIDCNRRLHSSTLLNNCQIRERCMYALKSKHVQLVSQQMVENEMKQFISSNFVGGSRTISRPNLRRNTMHRKSSAIHASWLPSAQIASSAFTFGTVAVLPFYTFMVVAPRAEVTKKLAASFIPYIGLGIVYAYLLYLSWTPDTIRLMFASKYWLPELPGIAKMFSSEMTLASAWIHLLAVDLFAARQVYFEGLHENIETRHSVSLCLLFCPIGILAHFITKALTTTRNNKTDPGIQ